jgi:hypothetical protein
MKSDYELAFDLMRHVTRNALRAESTENQFTFAKNPLPQGTRGRWGYVVPLHIFNVAAVVADKVVMPQAFGIESRGATFDRDFANETRLHQVPEIVISRGSGTPRIGAIHGFKDLGGSGMLVVLHEERHHRVPLWSAAQSAGFQRLPDPLGFHSTSLDYI